MEVVGPLRTCENGLHLAIGPQIVEFLGPTLWVAEYEDTDDLIDAGVKIVVRRARVLEQVEVWTYDVAIRWTLDICDLVVPVFESHTGDGGLRDAIFAARDGKREFATAIAWDTRDRWMGREIDRAAQQAAEAVYEAVLWKISSRRSTAETRINEHARRSAKHVIRVFRLAYGTDRLAAQRVLFTWLLRYLNH